MTRKRQIKAVKSSSKGKPKPAPFKPLVGPLESRDRPSWDEQADRQAAEAECDKFIAFILAREIEQKDPETHRTTQASGRRGFKALTLQDAGYSLAAEIAGGDGQLEIALEALALWLQEFVVPDPNDGFKPYIDTDLLSEIERLVVAPVKKNEDTNSERNPIVEEKKMDEPTPLPRWQTMPAGAFHHLQRKPHKRLRNGRTRTVVKNASGVRLKTAGEEWLWRELARSAFEDAETAKALHYLLGWHQGAALGFLQRFLAARHSSQDETRERLITTAAALVSGDKDRVAVTTKEDRQRIIKDHRPAPVITSAKSQSGKVGNPFRYQITAILDPTSFAAEDLPRGLRIDLRTGLISGTPKVPGKFKATIAATNAGGTGKARLNISISTTTKTA